MMSSTPDWHPIDLFLIPVCASWRMKMNAAESVYEFHCCSGHATRADVSKGAKRAPFLRDRLRRDARRRGSRLSHVLPARPQRCGTSFDGVLGCSCALPGVAVVYDLSFCIVGYQARAENPWGRLGREALAMGIPAKRPRNSSTSNYSLYIL